MLEKKKKMRKCDSLRTDIVDVMVSSLDGVAFDGLDSIFDWYVYN